MRKTTGVALVFLTLFMSAGCSNQSTETRAREAAKKIKASIPDVEAKALAQKVTPDEVKQAQEALTIDNQYQGDVNGTLDAVTVNAIEAFQREHDLKDDGILTTETRRLLKQELAKKPVNAG